MDDERTEAWWARRAWALLSAVRERSPLVQRITNLVSMDIAANALTAAGASPAMLHCLREIPDFTPRCDAVYINVGTLSEDWLPSMRAAASAGRPWVLDPVAAAASGFRMESCLELLVLRPAVVRGNASEILALAVGNPSPPPGLPPPFPLPRRRRRGSPERRAAAGDGGGEDLVAPPLWRISEPRWRPRAVVLRRPQQTAAAGAGRPSRPCGQRGDGGRWLWCAVASGHPHQI
ncbi:hypothetical protein VPH35_055473 [Triticum aestivum]|uniref:hydroxyethylthiazole kinase isoform X1 n=1 Tax=Triticum aestivum TaxID=4565 RepID=UPI0008453823|nr:hydroxyethylthiazole kinase-like isoform X1 [Triticum aestivum]